MPYMISLAPMFMVPTIMIVEDRGKGPADRKAECLSRHIG
jgi:hypothetical protein